MILSTLNNGLAISCDWLRFTLIDIDTNNLDYLSDALENFGFDISEFEKLPLGRFGYKSCLSFNNSNFCIYYNGNNNMGICFDLSGSTLDLFFDRFAQRLNTPFNENVFRSLICCIRAVANITRLDIAIDDFTDKFFTCDDIEKYYDNNQIRTKFRKHEPIKSDVCHKLSGYTINFGSRTSEVFLRIYDKALEQTSKGVLDVPARWLRYEFELKDSKANYFADILSCGESFSDIVMRLFNNYFRIIDRTDKNVSRCPNIELWDEFVSCVGKLKLSVPIHETTISEKEHWFVQCCTATLALIYEAHGGNFEYLHDLVLHGKYKLKPSQLALLEQYYRELEAFKDGEL